MSEEKILEALEDHPAGLSISDIASESDLHRNTISPEIKELVEDGKVEEKKVGTAKIYYLEEYSGIHDMDSQYEGENIQVGIGVSDLSDGFKAAQSAAKQAANQAAGGEEPTFSLVFVSSKYNDQVEEITKGFNKILGEDWIGATTDKELNSMIGYSEGTIEVLSIQSKYLHFSPVLVENYREEPVKKAEKATEKAVDEANVERSVHATSQYMRSTKKNFSDIIKNPPYFVLTFPGGVYFEDEKPILGRESELLQGIKNSIGSYIPIIGASASSDAEKLGQRKATNYIFSGGKYTKDGAVICFVVSELYFSYGLEHGYETTEKTGLITKVSNNGRRIEEINNNTALDEYSNLSGMSKEKLLEKFRNAESMKPIGVPDIDGKTYPISAGLNSDGKTLFSYFKLRENTPINIQSFDKEKSIGTGKNLFEKIKSQYPQTKPVISLIFPCMGRRISLRDDLKKSVKNIKEAHEEAPFIGFYSNGEIGGERGKQARYNNYTITALTIFDKLQTE